MGSTNTLPGPYRPRGAVFQIELADAGNDVLGLLGGVGVPAEPLAGLNVVDDDRGRGRAMFAIVGKGAGPMHRGVGLVPHLSAFKLVRVNNQVLGTF